MSRRSLIVRTVFGLCIGTAALFLLRGGLVAAHPDSLSNPVLRAIAGEIADPFRALSVEERSLVRFLLLLPLGALVVTAFRTLVGVPTFGSFTPVLLGLAFINLSALLWSLGIFLGTVLIGWKVRRLLERFRLLQVSRFSALLTVVILFLVILVTVTSRLGIPAAPCVSLFPLAILTHMAERFWVMETEAGFKAASKTLTGTLVIAVCVSLALNPAGVAAWFFAHPETLGLVLAAHLLLGRYTGFRLFELFRFRDLLRQAAETAATFVPVVEPASATPQ